MQLRKFYGRTVSAALAQVKRELGSDALILETILLAPDNPAARMHPEAKYEVLAARDTRQGSAPAAQPQAPAAFAARPGNADWRKESPLAEPPAAPAAPQRDPRLAQGRQAYQAHAQTAPAPARPEAPRPAVQSSQERVQLLQSLLESRAPEAQPWAAARPGEGSGAPSRSRVAPAGEPAPTPFETRAPQPPQPALSPAREAARNAVRAAVATAAVEDDLDYPIQRPRAAAKSAPAQSAINADSAIRNPQSAIPPDWGRDLNESLRQARPAAMPARRGGDVLEEMGLLRSQLNDLLQGELAESGIDPARLDLSDYHALISLGVEHDVLAPHFRGWLEWRTAPAAHRKWIAQLQAGPAARMQGESLREWLWLVWTEQLGLPQAQDARADKRPAKGPRVVALVGPTGSGKTTTLAKLASINRHNRRQNVAVLTLDTFRFGATEQWRRMGRLMGVEVEEIVSQADISRSMERWDRYDWIGIDTPGGLTPESAAGMLYGSLLAQYGEVESMVVLPATQRDSVNREQLKRYRALGARAALFTRMDESMQNGGIVNLTMDGKWKIDSFATGSRIPEDWESATPETLWRRVLAPHAYLGGAQ